MKTPFLAISIGVASAMLASLLVRYLALPLPVLVLSVATVSALFCITAEITPRIGAWGGAASALIVAAVLGLTLSAAPIEPGAHRPELRDLFWKPLLLLIVAVGSCGFAGWLSVRVALRLRLRR